MHSAGNLAGIGWMVADAFVMSAILLCGKGLGRAGAHPFQAIFLANALAALLALAWARGGARPLWPRHPRLHVRRAVLGIAATACLLAALRSLSLYEATALALLAPVATCVAALAVARQLPPARLVLALAATLGGVALLLAVQAGAGWRPAALAGVAFCAGTVLCSVLNNLNQKDIGTRESMTAQMLWGPLLSALLAAPVAAWFWRPLPGAALALAALYGVLLAVRMTTRYRAFRHGEVAVLMPFEYAQLPFAALLSAVFFGQRVTPAAAAGMALIGAGGALLVRGELARQRAEVRHG